MKCVASPNSDRARCGSIRHCDAVELRCSWDLGDVPCRCTGDAKIGTRGVAWECGNAAPGNVSEVARKGGHIATAYTSPSGPGRSGVACPGADKTRVGTGDGSGRGTGDRKIRATSGAGN